MSQHTTNVQITETSVVMNNQNVQVVNDVNGNIQLGMSMSINQNLIGNGFRFNINWQIVEVATGHIQSNNWSSQNFGQNYPLMVDQTFANGGGDYSFDIAETPDGFGVHSGGGQSAENSGAGLYILRVFLYIDTSRYEPNVYLPNGQSEWAISDDLVFWCE